MHLTADNWRHYCNTDGDCEIWAQGTNATGHPIGRLDGKTANVRRAVHALRFGEIAAGKKVGVTCGNTRCLEHTKVMTISEIVAMSYRSGRRAGEYPARLKGRMSSGTALDHAKVAQIRAMAGTHTHSELAAEFGVARSTISNAVAGRSWRSGASVFGWRA